MDGKTVVVTGAADGIGRAVATAFAEAGATVIGSAPASDDVESALDDVDGVQAFTADVRDEFDVERLMEHASRAGEHGGIDVVVPCAAVFHGDPGEASLQETAYAAYDDTMRTNARGVFAAVKEAIPHLTADARVLVPSGPVAREPEGMGVYPVSKAAAEALARGFAADLDQVVGVVDTGRVATDLTGEDGRDPTDVAPMFVWAATAADPARVDGEVLSVKTWVNEERQADR